MIEGADDPRACARASFVEIVVAAGLLREAPAPVDLVEVGEWTADDLVLEEHTDMADLLGLDPIHDADENVGWPMRRTDH